MWTRSRGARARARGREPGGRESRNVVYSRSPQTTEVDLQVYEMTLSTV